MNFLQFLSDKLILLETWNECYLFLTDKIPPGESLCNKKKMYIFVANCACFIFLKAAKQAFIDTLQNVP